MYICTNYRWDIYQNIRIYIYIWDIYSNIRPEFGRTRATRVSVADPSPRVGRRHRREVHDQQLQEFIASKMQEHLGKEEAIGARGTMEEDKSSSKLMRMARI